MERIRTLVSAGSLVASPLLLLAYWFIYPAYGEFAGDEIIRQVDRAPVMTAVSDVFITLGALLAVPMSLALMRVLRGATPRLALLGGSLSLIGWVAVTALVMIDVVAVEIANQGPSDELVRMFEDLLTNPLVIGLNVVASLHLIGGVDRHRTGPEPDDPELAGYRGHPRVASAPGRKPRRPALARLDHLGRGGGGVRLGHP